MDDARIARPRRSALYMPGANARALEKAKTLAADCVILDLEDSVAPAAKADARAQVCAAVQAGGYGAREVVIRVNGLDTPWGRDDIAAAAAAGPDAILLPKVSSAADLNGVVEVLADASGGAASNAGALPALWAMIETPLAILNIAEIGGWRGPNGALVAFVAGTNDLAKETGASLGEDRVGMLTWLSLLVAGAKANGIAAIDGVYNNFKDADGLRAECAHGLALGMDGKTLIHPGQLAIANEVFAPSPDAVSHARAILDAYALPENADAGVITVDGKMVERLHEAMARQTVAIADRIAAMGE
ncbi:MAG: CoA ester lyase [Pseudomonadota bacterium]